MYPEISSHYDNALRFMHEHSAWFLQIALILGGTALVSIVLQRLLRLRCRPNSWRQAVVTAASTPLRAFVWVGGLSMACTLIYEDYELGIFKSFLSLQPILHILILGWFLVRLARTSLTVVAVKHPAISVGRIDTAQKVSTTLITIAVVLLILPSFGISLSGMLAFGGVGGIIVGLAAKDTITNLFGALMLYFDRPFAVGDAIVLPEKNVEGLVENIGWRQVVIRMPDKRLVYVPNAIFGTMVLINSSQMSHRRIFETIGIRYEDYEKLPLILEDIRAYLAAEPELDHDTLFYVDFDKFNAYSVDIILSVYTRVTEMPKYLALKARVMGQISNVILQHGADFAYPTQVLQINRTPTKVEKAESL